MDDFLTSGEWCSVTSSNVAEARYDADREHLAIRFLSGKVYTYPGVPADVAADFISAPSKGRWVHRTLVATGWSWF